MTTAADKPESSNKRGSPSHEETDGERLRGIVAPAALSIDLVSVLAGDRVPTGDEERLLSDMRRIRGQRFFSDVLYAVTHQFFAPEIAEKMWHKILLHKREISEALHRDVRIIVAALDYLTSRTTDLDFPTLIDESHISEIVGLSMHDGLTGLLNHTTCHEIISVEIKNYARHGTVVSLILLDIDDFKLVNDQSGHLEGDRILKELAVSLQKESRDSDVCCRYGGDEFAVLLPFTNIRMAGEIAERILLAAREIRSGELALALSIGAASCSADVTTTEALVRKADHALYRAKEAGKNCVRLET